MNKKVNKSYLWITIGIIIVLVLGGFGYFQLEIKKPRLSARYVLQYDCPSFPADSVYGEESATGYCSETRHDAEISATELLVDEMNQRCRNHSNNRCCVSEANWVDEWTVCNQNPSGCLDAGYEPGYDWLCSVYVSGFKCAPCIEEGPQKELIPQ